MVKNKHSRKLMISYYIYTKQMIIPGDLSIGSDLRCTQLYLPALSLTLTLYKLVSLSKPQFPWLHQFSSVQLLCRVQLFVKMWTAAYQASLSFTISWNLLKCPLSWWCHPAISSSVIPFSSCLQSFPASGSFPISQFFTSGVQSIGVSGLASVLPVNIQDWFPLGWTGWISLQSEGLSRVFSNTTVQSISSSLLSLLYDPTLTSVHDYLKNHSFDYLGLCR